MCARYLVPDTNGFVDQLQSIKTLVECGHFIVTVPLVGEWERESSIYSSTCPVIYGAVG